MPARPASDTTTTFHCSISCLKLMIVPMCTSSRKMPVLAPKGISTELLTRS